MHQVVLEIRFSINLIGGFQADKHLSYLISIFN